MLTKLPHEVECAICKRACRWSEAKAVIACPACIAGTLAGERLIIGDRTVDARGIVIETPAKPDKSRHFVPCSEA